MGLYTALYSAAVVLLAGLACYFCQKYPITKENKLYKYRPKPDSFLLRSKLFKDTERFNYFLLIPYLFSWFVLIGIFIMYCLYWFGLQSVENILSSYYLVLALALLYFTIALYVGVIQFVVAHNYDSCYSRSGKETKKFIQNQIKQAMKEPKSKEKKGKK